MICLKSVVSIALIVTATSMVIEHGKVVEDFRKIFQIFGDLSDEDLLESKHIFAPFLEIFERSIDVECAAEKVKVYGLEEELANLTHQHKPLDKHGHWQLAFILLEAGLPCSSKTRPVTNFAFDFVMSFGHVVRAFKDEPEMMGYAMLLKCANNYAVKENLIDTNEYSIDHDLKSSEEEMCTVLQMRVIEAMNKGNVGDVFDMKCKGPQRAVNSMLRTALLTQIELSPEQRKVELGKFYRAQILLDSKESARCEFDSVEYFVKALDDISAQINHLFKL